MDLGLRRDLDKVIGNLNRFERKQLPFATSLALNTVAADAQKRSQRRMRIDLDKPTRFTLQGVAVKRSTKRKLESAVYIKEIQAEYLKYQVEGGTRRPKNRAIVVPVKVRLNKFGNIPRRKIKALLTRDDVFVVRESKAAGIYQRMKSGKLKMLVAFEPKADYEKRFPFGDIVIKEAQTRMAPALRQSLRRALSTAK